MSLENKLTNCPLCKCLLNDNVNRLIKELCGHLKCRACLVAENSGCQECFASKNKNKANPTETVITLCSEDQNIVYNVSENAVASDYIESGSDKLQIDTDSESAADPAISKSNCQLKLNRNHRTKSKTSRRSRSLYSHILTKTNDNGKYFECNVCKKNFTSRGHRHYHLFCNNIDKPLKCDICRKEFITKFHYNYHLETHQKNLQFKCPKCDRSYLRSNSLRKHLKQHSNERKPYICSISDCGARFQSSSILKLHENKHKNIYPFKCEKCDQKFTLKSNLQNHLVVHLQEKAFVCDLCGKKFARKGALKLHSSSHSDVRPYECKYCNKTFTHQRIYSRHLSIHLGIKIFNCPFCDAKCSRKDNFYRHLRNLHPNSNYKETIVTELNSVTKQNAYKLTAENDILEDTPPNETSAVNETEIMNTKETECPRNISNVCVTDGPNSVNVIQSVGNVVPIEMISLSKSTENEIQEVPSIGLPEYRSKIAKEISQITNQINSTPVKRIVNVNKPKKPYDPIEIYRKILMPNTQDEEDDDEEKVCDSNENTSQKEHDLTKNISLKPPPIDFSEVHWRKRTSQYFIKK